jgi:voltage-dependent potassium channel beta subunit
MEYRKIGKWGIRVSEIGLGSWMTYGGGVDDAESISQIHHAVEKGINFLDTANVYAHGHAEEVTDMAMGTMKRDAIVLATKVFFPMGPGANDKGLSRKHIFEQCHLSLKRLRTDYIDIYQCHRYDANVEVYEVVRSMDDLIRQGKILYWGVSEWSAPQIESAVAIAHDINAMPPISNQPQYNMLARQIEESVIPVSSANGLGQVVWSPLAQGILTGKYKIGDAHPTDSRAANNKMNAFIGNVLRNENLEIVSRLMPIAKEQGLSMAQLALAWCLRLPDISSVIIGATKKNQIDDNIGAAGKKLSADVISAIEGILRTPARI